MGSGPKFSGDRAKAASQMHDGAVGGEDQLGETASEARPVLYQGDETARRHVHTFENAFQQQDDFPDQPIVGVCGEQSVGGQNLGRVALGPEDQQAEIGFVGAEVQERIVEVSRHGEGPECISGGVEGREVHRQVVRAGDGECGPARGAVERDLDMPVGQPVAGDGPLQRRQRDSGPSGPVGAGGEALGAVVHRGGPG